LNLRTAARTIGGVLLTISTTHAPATDLGFLLHKHPGRVNTRQVASGAVFVFFPEATEERCTLRCAGGEDLAA
jgi:hypothetical protein